MGSSLLKLIAVLLVSSVMFLPLSFAQTTTGDIGGTVTDQTGAAVPGCALTLTDQATIAERKTTSDAQSDFSFRQLPVGSYNLTVTKQGFKTMSQRNLPGQVATMTTSPVKLEVGATAETVTVEAAAINLNTENGEVGNVMLSDQVSQLPLNGRNFIELTTLMPGASVGGGFDNKNKGLLAGVDISFSGAPANANQWQVNGTNNNDVGSQRTILVYPSVDAIQEFKILRNSYGPEYGGAGGAQINLVTKGGGNQFHGDAYYYGRNDVLNAENFFLGQQKIGCVPGAPVCGKKNFLRRNDFGYTVGGPVKKDKIFFFWSEEWNRERRGQVRQAWIPTPAEIGGNFTDIAGCPPGSGAPPVPNDPLTGHPFPNNTIPSDRLSPAGQAYLSQLPAPNISNLCASHDWVSQVGIPLNWREDNIRGDLNITKSTSLMINFTNESWVNPLHGYEEGGPWGNRQDLFAWKDDFSISIKRHTFKMGVLYDQNAKDEEQGDEAGGMWGAAGIVTSTGPSLSGSGYAWSSPTGGNQWSDTILKNVLWGVNENSKNVISDPRWRDVELYFGDNWKATKTLTLDYGLRWSFMPDAWLADNRLAAFEPYAYNPKLSPATSACNGIVLAAGAPNGCAAQGFAGGVYSKNRSIVPSNYHLIAPRLGVAWDVFCRGNWVLLAGVGQFSTADPLTATSPRLVGANPPFTTRVRPG